MGSTRRSITLFAVAGGFFGGTFVAARAGQTDVPPLLLVALRFDVAAVLVAGYVVATTPRDALVPRTRGDLVAIASAGVLAIGLANGFLFVGQGYVSSAVGAILFSLVPIFSPVLAGTVLEDESLTVPSGVGAVVGLLGVALVLGVRPSTVTAVAGGGGVLVLGGAALAAVGTVLIRGVGSSVTTGSAVRLAWALPLSAVVLHTSSALAGESVASVEWTTTALLSVAYLGVFAGAVAYVAYFELLETVGAIRSSLLFYASPLVASVGGWALLAEPLSPVALLGFAVVVLGFTIATWESLRPALGRYWRGRVGGSPTRSRDHPVERYSLPQDGD